MKYKDFETLKSNEDFKRVYTKRVKEWIMHNG